MAGDLIPPPSPAGRPQPAGTPRLVELPSDRPKPAAERTPAPPRGPLPPSRFRNRFGFIAGALAGVVFAAAGVLGIVLTGGSQAPRDPGFARNWSKWRPSSTNPAEGASEIAAHVGPKYKSSDGRQLSLVTGGTLQIQGIPLSVALRPDSGGIQLMHGPGVMYTLNGLGASGSVASGKPTAERKQLLRREALELALYSFRYLPDITMVVALLPPEPPKKSKDGNGTAADPDVSAIFYRPGDLVQQLQTPLGTTVPANTPVPEKLGGAEAKLIDELTVTNEFKASFIRGQDLSAYLVLDSLPKTK